MAWAAAALVVAAAFWVVVEVAAVAGFFGVLMGERIERCHHCGRVGLTSGHAMHPDGCPPHPAAQFLHHLHAEWVRRDHHLAHPHLPHFSH